MSKKDDAAFKRAFDKWAAKKKLSKKEQMGVLLALHEFETSGFEFRTMTSAFAAGREALKEPRP